MTACETDRFSGEFIAKELVADHTIDNLFAFGRRLAETHRMMSTHKHGG